MVLLTADDSLTADVGRVGKGCGNLWIEVDHKVTLLRKLLVAVFDLLRDPLSEVVAEQRIDHINDPLPWQLDDISFLRQV